MKNIRYLVQRTLGFGGLLGGALLVGAQAQAGEELNALVWCDHMDPELVQPFEKQHNVKVNLREYEGTGTALAMIDQSQPGDWDVFVVDSTDVPRVVAKGLLSELTPGNFPWSDIPERVRAPEMHYVSGKLYAVPEKFGYNTVAFDKTKVSIEDMRNASSIFDPKYKGRVAVYDYYLSIISQISVALGKAPADLTDSDLPAIREKLVALKKNAAMIGDVVTSQTALATGQVDILVGGGEFVVASLMKEKPNLDWVLPTQGGVRWTQAIGVMQDSKRKALGEKFVSYILSPEAQAKLATSSCYWGMPANTKATLSDEQKKTLRWDEQPGYIASSQTYPALNNVFDRKLQDLWTEFLQM